jgi:hypothetical protein
LIAVYPGGSTGGVTWSKVSNKPHPPMGVRDCYGRGVHRNCDYAEQQCDNRKRCGPPHRDNYITLSFLCGAQKRQNRAREILGADFRQPQRVRLELGLCFNDWFQRVNNLDC